MITGRGRRRVTSARRGDYAQRSYRPPHRLSAISTTLPIDQTTPPMEPAAAGRF